MAKTPGYRHAPVIPKDEEQRLRALEDARILDTGREKEFDDLLRLACAICQTPMGTITLVDKDRQWFKSRIGVDAPETPRDISFCGHVILQEPLFEIEDATKDERFAENPMVTGKQHLRFYAGVPLASPEGYNIGVLCVSDTQPRKLTEEQRELLILLAEKVTSLLHLRQQMSMMANSLANSMNAERELLGSNRLFTEFMDNAPVVVKLKDEDGRLVWYNRLCSERFGVDRKQWIGKLDAERWPAAEATAVRRRDLAVLAGERLVETTEQDRAPDGSTRYWNTYRFAFVDHAGRKFIASLALDATRVAVAEAEVERTQRELQLVNAQLSELAVTDGLTGLKNRRAFDERLRQDFALAVRHDLSLSLLMIDVDHFKQFNDTYGHAEGDEILRTLAKILQESVRATDMVARYGGEEFAIILPNTMKEKARLLAARIARAVEAMPVRHRRITISIGISSKYPELVNREHFIALADEALYRAKSKGRNCVVVAEP